MRRALQHPFAPALGCLLAGAVYIMATPATADMAAHDYRTWLFQHAGLTVWNAQWYGGHHVLGYSLLFAPLAALLALCAVWASPVAGAYLVLAVVAAAIADGAEARRTALLLGIPTVAG